MPFVTKVDYSDNRQIKQFELTNTQLSGTTVFGVDFSGLTNGVDGNIINTGFYTGITSTFSGDSNTTTFFFGQPEMNIGIETLEPITNINSGDTQVGIGYQGINPIIIDGNTVFGSYTGVTFDLNVTSIEEISPNIFTGVTNSDTVTLLSGGSIDFSGRTIWVDVKGITKTKKLILTDEPELDNTLTTVLGRDVNGEIKRVNIIGLTGGTSGGTNSDDYTTGVTFNNQILEFTRLSGGTYSADTSNLTWQSASSTFGSSNDVTQNLIAGQATSFTLPVVHNGAIMSPEMVTNTMKNKGFAGLDITGTGAGSSVFSVRIKGNNPNNGNIDIGDSTSDVNLWNPISEGRKNTIALKRSFKSTVGATQTSVGSFQLTGVYANNPVNMDIISGDSNTYYAAFESNPVITGTYLPANPHQVFALRGKGRVLLSDYGSGAVSGTPTYNLTVDSTGRFIETPLVNGTTDYISNVALNNNILSFSGVGSAFSSAVDLTSLGNPTPPEDLVSTQIIELGEIGSTNIEDAFNTHLFTGTEDPIQDQADGYVLINTTRSSIATQYLFIGSGGTYGISGTSVAIADDFSLIETGNIEYDVWRDSGGVNKAFSYTQPIRRAGTVTLDNILYANGTITTSFSSSRLRLGGNYGTDFLGGNPNHSRFRFNMGVGSGVVTAYSDALRTWGNVEIGRTINYPVGTGGVNFIDLIINPIVNFLNANTANSRATSIYVNPSYTNIGSTKLYSILSERGDVEFKNGLLNLGSYGSGAVSGTPTYNLTVDNNGNVIESEIIPFVEENIIGTAIYRDQTNIVGGEIILNLSGFSSCRINLDGANATIVDSSGRPTTGQSFTRYYELSTTNGTEIFTLPLDWIQIGTLDNTVTNYLVVEYSNYPTVGLSIKAFINQA